MFSQEFQSWAQAGWQARAGLWEKAPAWPEALAQLNGQEQTAFQALGATLPATDVGDYSPQRLIPFLREGLAAREDFGWCRALPERVQAEAVVTCGLSPRDSMTLSSLAEPVLCVQRALPRPDGGTVEPQEFPLPALPGPAAELLPLLGLWLLQMPLTEGRFPWYSQVEKRGQGGPG